MQMTVKVKQLCFGRLAVGQCQFPGGLHGLVIVMQYWTPRSGPELTGLVASPAAFSIRGLRPAGGRRAS